jgi:hypothetical protein
MGLAPFGSCGEEGGRGWKRNKLQGIYGDFAECPEMGLAPFGSSVEAALDECPILGLAPFGSGSGSQGVGRECRSRRVMIVVAATL